MEQGERRMCVTLKYKDNERKTKVNRPNPPNGSQTMTRSSLTRTTLLYISSLSKINNSFSYATRLQNYKINLLKFFKIIQKYNEETIQISFSSNCSEK